MSEGDPSEEHVAGEGSPDGPSTDRDGTGETGPVEAHEEDPEPAGRAGTEPPATDGPEPAESTATTVASEPVAPAELTGPERRLEPQVRYVWVLQAAVSALVFGAVLGVPALIIFSEPLLGPAVFTLVFVVGASLALFRYRSWRYQVREDSLFLERGVLTRTKTVVPYVRIQHVDASRGPVERAFGLATAVVYTAGSRGADVSIPGLTPDRADELQDRLKRLAIAAEGEDAV